MPWPAVQAGHVCAVCICVLACKCEHIGMSGISVVCSLHVERSVRVGEMLLCGRQSPVAVFSAYWGLSQSLASEEP